MMASKDPAPAHCDRSGAAGERLPADGAAGRLYVVATPIGNLADLSPRATQVLSSVALIAAEDTRRAGLLFGAAGQRPQLVSVNAHNYRERLGYLLEVLGGGADVAVVTDAGTPAVSDPGGALVAAAWDAGIRVVPVPGPSAVATALSVAGFAAERYLFAGYVPKKPGRRERFWQWVDEVGETTVIFETPHRIGRTMSDMAARWPDRLMLLARELTKAYEELLRGTVAAVFESTRDRTWKGEITIVLAAAGSRRSDQARRESYEDHDV